MQHLDPHERPPHGIRDVYKKYQKMKIKELDQDPDIIDLSSDGSGLPGNKIRVVKEWTRENLTSTFRTFAGHNGEFDLPPIIPVYEHEDIPGLHVIPSLLPPEIQHILLSHLLHRDLSNSAHLTNIHTHYNISYPLPFSTPNAPPSSFFSLAPASSSVIATPIDPTVHKPLNISQFLSKKLRWTTLGGQYDWTAKRYPDASPPPFPSDIKQLLEGLFTDTKAEAAIVNLYSPGDTLSVHRDVAETSSTGLISISLGCDAIFVIGTSRPSTQDSDAQEKVLALRLRSGSVVYMSGASRFAWHGVPQIVPNTCPEHLKHWPGTAEGGRQYEEWKGWMAGKRVNLNVRQMRN
ncbi:Nn.00g060420.m01.CDS01 [Neocucurbitaria sp. VM-36]